MAYDANYLAGPVYVGGKQGKRMYFLETVDGTATISLAGYITNASAPAAGHMGMSLGDAVIITQRASLPNGAGAGSDTYTISTISTAGAATVIKTSTT